MFDEKQLQRQISKVANSALKYAQKVFDDNMNRMKDATFIVWSNSRAKRSMMLNKQGQSVSNPGDSFGVPVQSGKLQGSIKKEVGVSDGKIVGRVYTHGIPYAARIEFGFKGRDSEGRLFNQEPRPFMRQGLDVSQSEIKKIFNKSHA